MGELFANFEAYDVQATRKEAREEGIAQGIAEGIAEGIVHSIRMMKESSVTREVTKQQLMKQFDLKPEAAEENLRLYW